MDQASPFDELPGDLMVWVLIVSELVAFGAGLAAFLAVRITDPAGFVAAQGELHAAAAGANTLVLVTSGYLAALAVRRREAMRTATAPLVAAAALGVVFLAVKGAEFVDLARAGITTETHPFFTFYWLLTGFHAAHVAAGAVILLLVARFHARRNVEAGAQFWHMVDLVWVILFPTIYLL